MGDVRLSVVVLVVMMFDWNVVNVGGVVYKSFWGRGDPGCQVASNLTYVCFYSPAAA